MSRHGVPVPPPIYPAAFSGVPILILDNFGLFMLPVAKPIRRSGLVPVWDTRCSQLGCPDRAGVTSFFRETFSLSRNRGYTKVVLLKDRWTHGLQPGSRRNRDEGRSS
jgi:hypothetical protein